MPRLVFCSPHSVIDPSSGAAVITLDLLRTLSERGVPCQAFGTCRLDFRERIPIQQLLAERGLPYEIRRAMVGQRETKCVFTRCAKLPITLWAGRRNGSGDSAEDVLTSLLAFDRFLVASRPNVVLTYGGDPVAMDMMKLAKRRCIPVVFGLHNFAYNSLTTFQNVDQIIVPSEFSRRFYQERLGLDCTVLPYVIDHERILVNQHRPQYLTFVNPEVTKGRFVVARVIEQLARRRPDIPILIVEGRARGKALESAGLDLSWVENLHVMRNTHDPRKFYAVTKLLLMPSLWNESFGLVVAEAMMNGIPVLASNRGALPETVGNGGILLDIPAHYTPRSRNVPTAQEVEPWVENVIRLWDDEAAYQHQAEAARQHAQQWMPGTLISRYTELFEDVARSVRV